MGDFETMTAVLDPPQTVTDDPVGKTKEQAVTTVPERGAFEAVIIGGGPAGITAGIYLARKRINTLLISPELGGQVSWTADIENYPGYRVISGYDLAGKLQTQLMENHIHLRLGDEVTGIETAERGGIVRTKAGAEYRWKSLVVASGKQSKSLNVPGEKEFRGRGVTYCTTCDAPLFRGETVAVVGGGNSALSAANDLVDLGCTVHLVNISAGLQADNVLVERALGAKRVTLHADSTIREIMGEKSVTGIRVRDNATENESVIGVSGVFVEIGLIPNSGFAEGLLTMNQHREIMVDCRCMTNVPGIFAAGDVTNVPNKQIVIAAGEGAKAALGVGSYLRMR